VTARRYPPSGRLMRRIAEVVAEPRWGGGLSRDQLAAELRVRPWDRVFLSSLFACYRRGLVRLAGGYVVVPWPDAPPGDSEPPF